MCGGFISSAILQLRRAVKNWLRFRNLISPIRSKAPKVPKLKILVQPCCDQLRLDIRLHHFQAIWVQTWKKARDTRTGVPGQAAINAHP